MRNASAALQALVATGSYQIEKDVLIEAVVSEEATALRSYRNYLGQNWIVALDFSESVDQTIASGTLILAREHQDVSLAPLMEGSLANEFGAGTYAPAIDGGREIEIRVAILPHRQSATIAIPGANAGATVVPVSPLPYAAPRGASVLLDNDTPVYLTAPAAKGATSITVTPLPGGVSTGGPVLVNGAAPTEPYDPAKQIYDVGDWIPILQGVTDKPDWGGRKNEVSVTFRNRLAVLADQQIIDAFKVGLPDVKTPVEDVSQQIINHEVPGSFTVYTYPEPPGFEIVYGDVQPQLVWEALQGLVSQYGGRVQHKQRNGYGDYDLCLVLPDRENTTPQYTIPPSQYIDIPSIDLDRSQVRTIIRVAYVDEDTGTLQYLQHPAPGTEADDPQVKKYGPIKMQLAFGAAHAINTEPEARNLLLRTHSDVSTPPLPQEVECFTVPWVELDDRILLPANGVHYDTDQVGVVIGISWSFPRKGGGRMTIRTAEKAKGAFYNYRNLDAQIYGFNASQRETPPTIPLPALNNFGPTEKNGLGVTVGWTPGTSPRVAQVWVYELQTLVPFNDRPVPTGETPRTAVLTTETEYFIEYPPKGFEKFAYFVPVSSVGTEGRPEISHVLPAEGFPTVALSSVQGATMLYSDVTLSLNDPQGLGGTLRVWLNRALPGDATNSGPGEAYALIASTPATVGPSTSFALTAGGNANVLDEVRTHPNLGKTVFAEFINEQGVSSGVQRFYLKPWGDIVDGNGRLRPLAIDGADQVTAAVINSTHLVNTVPIVRPVSALPASGVFVGEMVTNTSESPRRIYQWSGSAWSTVGTTMSSVVGTLVAAQIGAGIVNTSHLGARVVTAANLTVADFDNLVENPRADQGVTGWAANSVTTVSVTGQGLPVQNGFAYAGTSTAFGTTFIPVQVGEHYRIAVTGRNADNPGNWKMRLQAFFYNAASQFLTGSIIGEFLPSANTFSTKAGLVQVPANAAYMRVAMAADVAPTSGLFHFTEMIVNRATNANLLVDGTVTALKVNAAQFTSADTNPAAVIRLRATNAIPASATSYLDLAATGTAPILKHPKLSLNADGSAVFTGTVTVGAGTTFEAGYSPLSIKAGVSQVIRSNAAPTTRTDGAALVTGDVWINTTAGQGDRPSSWNGSAWIGTDTVIGYGRIVTPTLSALSVDAGTVSAGLLQNAASSPTAAVRLDAGTTMPLTVTRYLDLGATGSAPFLKHDKLSLNADGGAFFSGDVQIVREQANGVVFKDSGLTVAKMEANDSAGTKIVALKFGGTLDGAYWYRDTSPATAMTLNVVAGSGSHALSFGESGLTIGADGDVGLSPSSGSLVSFSTPEDLGARSASGTYLSIRVNGSVYYLPLYT